MKEIWLEQDVGGLKIITRHTVRSRKRKHFNLELFLDRAVTVGMYGWAAILSIFAIMAFIRCI